MAPRRVRMFQIAHLKLNSAADLQTRERFVKLRIDDPREGFGVIYVAPRKIQNDLLSRNRSHKRREIHIEMPHRTSKRVDIRKSEYLRHQAWRERNLAHPPPFGKNSRQKIRHVAVQFGVAANRCRAPFPKCQTPDIRLMVSVTYGTKQQLETIEFCRISILFAARRGIA